MIDAEFAARLLADRQEAVVLTIGTFDLFHEGHVELLRDCRILAGPRGTLIVGVNTDAFVERFKGIRTTVKLGARMAILRACEDVDAVLVNVGNESAAVLIEAVRPALIAIGDDWAPPRDYLGQLGVTRDYLEDLGARIVYLKRTTGESSTRIRGRLS